MLDTDTSYDPGPGVGGIIAIVLMGTLYVAFIAFAIYLYMRVARKAGWTLWHGLLVLVPVANFVFIVMFAFQEWPIERRLRDAEARLAMAGLGAPQGYGGYPPGGYGAPAPQYGDPQYGGAYPAAPYGTEPPAPYGGHSATPGTEPTPPAPEPTPPGTDAAGGPPPSGEAPGPWAPPAR